ncbi:MAG: ChbG/HpnK family deacetylase [Bacteroidota bacterium]
MKFVITADDFGVNPIIDQAIQQAVLQGNVTNVAGMANGTDATGQFSVQALKNLKEQFPHISIGLHITLTSGRAVSGRPATLVKNDHGQFKGMISQASLDLSTEEKRRQFKTDLEAELRAQIEVFDKIGLPIEHFSDHVGILTLHPFTAEVYYGVVKEYNPMSSVRNPVLTAALVNEGCLRDSQMFILGRVAGVVPGISKYSLEGMSQVLQLMQQAGLKTTDYFVEHLYKNPFPHILRCILNNTPTEPNPLVQNRVAPEPVAEIVSHLAIKPSQSPTYQNALQAINDYGGVDPTYLQANRYREYEMLMEELPNYKGQPGVELVSF